MEVTTSNVFLGLVILTIEAIEIDWLVARTGMEWAYIENELIVEELERDGTVPNIGGSNTMWKICKGLDMGFIDSGWDIGKKDIGFGGSNMVVLCTCYEVY